MVLVVAFLVILSTPVALEETKGWVEVVCTSKYSNYSLFKFELPHGFLIKALCMKRIGALTLKKQSYLHGVV